MVYLVVFTLVWAESAIFAGFLIPGESGLIVGGVLAGLGRVNVVTLAACGVAGAVIGDSVGFEVGRHFGLRLRSTRLGKHVKAEHWSRAERFMQRYGGRSVLLGRWVSFGRALIPALAGAARMRYRTFLLWNALGGMTWALTVTAVGFFAGGSWRHVEKIFGRAVLLVVLAGVAAATVVAAGRWVAHHPDQVKAWARRQANRPWVRALLDRHERQVRWLARRMRPGSAFGLHLTVGLALIVAAGWAFGAVVQDVIAGEESARRDLPILRALAHAATWVSEATSIWAALVAAAIGLALTWRRPGRRTRITLAGSAGAGALLLALTLGLTVGRTPPPAMYTVAAAPTGHGSFPAVGVTVTTAVAGLFAAQASVSARSWARAVAAWTAAILWAGAAGAAAAYLGTQWTTDVLGGWTLAAAWNAVLLTGGWTWFRRQANEARAPEDDDITPSPPRPAY